MRRIQSNRRMRDSSWRCKSESFKTHKSPCVWNEEHRQALVSDHTYRVDERLRESSKAGKAILEARAEATRHRSHKPLPMITAETKATLKLSA